MIKNEQKEREKKLQSERQLLSCSSEDKGATIGLMGQTSAPLRRGVGVSWMYPGDPGPSVNGEWVSGLFT